MPSQSITVSSGRVEPGWFIVSNDSASPEMVIKIFLKVLELFECGRGDKYMTANIYSFASLILNNYGRWFLIKCIEPVQWCTPDETICSSI